MTGAEIITFLLGNYGAIVPATTPVAGAIFTAIFLRSNTSAKEFEKVKAGLLKEVAEDLLSEGKMTYTEFYKAKNFLDIAEKADQFHEEKKERAIENYDFDWFIRFYESSGNVSDEEMQILWAKVLAGEINGSKKYSIKAIDVLSKMGKKDAELFKVACSHSLLFGDRNIIPNYDAFLKKSGISFSDIMTLSEHNLLHSDGTIVREFTITNQEAILYASNSRAVTVKSRDDNAIDYKFKQFPFTLAGCQLAQLFEIYNQDEDIMCFAEELGKDSRVEINVYPVNNRDGERIFYDASAVLYSSIW